MEDNQSCVWMLGTPPEGKGGISSVIQQYQAAGFFDGGSVHFEPTHHRRSKWGRMLPFLHCAIKLWPALLVGRVELIHAHTSQDGSFWRKLLLVLPAIILDVPAIVHLHGSNFMDFHSQGGRWRRHWMRFLFRRSFRVIALSEEWKQWVLSVEPNARVEVVFNSLASQTGIGVKTSFHQYPTVLFLGTIGERKGSFDLLRAFAAVKSQVPQARLVVGGDGDVEGLLAKAKTLHISDAIDYVGWVDGEDKSRLMSESWVFALPSYHEGLPMAILEAMAFAELSYRVRLAVFRRLWNMVRRGFSFSQETLQHLPKAW